MANTRLQRTFSQAATSTKKGTFSFWMKRASISGEQDILASPYGSGRSFIRFESDGKMYGTINNASDYYITNRLFRDTSAWYHIVLAIDLTQSTSTDRLKFYVNGDLVTSYSSQVAPSSSETISWGQNGKITDIGYDTTDGGAGYFDGSLSHVHWIDGTAYDASYFGSTDSTTGEWKINTSPSVTYGNNGFFILKDGNTITDSSTNSNNFSLGGGTLTKTEDNPDNVFATLNGVKPGLDQTLSNGNTTMVSGSATTRTPSQTTLGMSSGKYYAEFKITSSNNTAPGIVSTQDNSSVSRGTAYYPGSSSDGYGYNGSAGIIANNGSSVGGTYSTFAVGDIISCALDLDNNKLYFSKNGTWQNSGVPTSGSTGTGAVSITTPSSTPDGFYYFSVGDGSGGASSGAECNFGNGYFGTTAVSSAGTNASGNGIFEYDVPANFTALSTKGLNL